MSTSAPPAPTATTVFPSTRVLVAGTVRSGSVSNLQAVDGLTLPINARRAPPYAVAGTWTAIDSQTVGPSQTPITVVLTGTLSDYVSNAGMEGYDGNVRFCVEFPTSRPGSSPRDGSRA